MALSETEQLLLEEVKSMLGDGVKLGLSIHKDTDGDKSSTSQWLRENIDQQFGLDTAGLTHHEGITAAFKKVHDYKPLESPTFHVSFRKEMTAQGIPGEEISKAMSIADKVLSKILGKNDNEKDSGWHPDLDEVLETARPE